MDDTSVSENFRHELLEQSIAFMSPQDDGTAVVEIFTLNKVVICLSVI